MDEDDPDERCDQRQAGHVGEDASVGVDEAVAENGRKNARNTDQDDSPVNAQPRSDRGKRLAAKNEICGEKAQVHDDDQNDDQERAIGTELAACLHHLGNP